MVLHMSHKERDRFKVIEQIHWRRLSQVQAARLLHVRERQVRRIVRRRREQGDGGLVHRSRCRVAANHVCPARRDGAVRVIKTDYRGAG